MLLKKLQFPFAFENKMQKDQREEKIITDITQACFGEIEILFCPKWKNINKLCRIN
jgi:hypothetical protein